jgi:hypothetical protein
MDVKIDREHDGIAMSQWLARRGIGLPSEHNADHDGRPADDAGSACHCSHCTIRGHSATVHP